MKEILIIRPKNISKKMDEMVSVVENLCKTEVVTEYNEMLDLRNRKILFCLDLDITGHSIEIIRFINDIKTYGGEQPFKGSVGCVFVSSSEDTYTKRASQELILAINQLGCRFLGHSIIEAINGLKNFRTWQITVHKTLEEILKDHCTDLINRLLDFELNKIENKKILVLHASSHETSNTLLLWDLVNKNLNNADVKVHHVENGSIVDCKGCDFKTCNHYSKQNSCFYGGLVVREILSSIEEADIIVWICPNYNDALSANLSALINRLTALYRRITFYDKLIYAVIVSGNSGSDSVANQLLGALNINKGFQLPPNFALMEIANDPGSVLKVDGIEEKALKFAEQINKEISAR